VVCLHIFELKLLKILCNLAIHSGCSTFVYIKNKNKDQQEKATFTGRCPRHTQVRHPDDTQQKPGVDIRAAKEKGHVKCEMI
jgi:hypothetical protein